MSKVSHVNYMPRFITDKSKLAGLHVQQIEYSVRYSNCTYFVHWSIPPLTYCCPECQIASQLQKS
jgi:hypothetical protein